ncbi:MAG: hypothetical protein ACOYMN_25430, partial [Roseimicrobium sp.]
LIGPENRTREDLNTGEGGSLAEEVTTVDHCKRALADLSQRLCVERGNDAILKQPEHRMVSRCHRADEKAKSEEGEEAAGFHD